MGDHLSLTRPDHGCSSSAPKIRYGTVGSGKHLAKDLLPSLRLIQDAELAAVSSRSPEKARALADRWQAEHAFESWREMVDSSKVDALIASTPPAIHEEIAAYCLKRGVHVFVEKPPAENLAGLKRLVELEKEHSNVVTFVGFNFPYGTSYTKFLATMQASGRIRHIRLRFVSSKPIAPEWNFSSVFESLLLSAGSHPINLITRVFGSPEEVRVERVTLGDAKLLCNIQLSFSCGARASIELGNYLPRFQYRCEMVNQAGVHGILDQHNELEFSGLPETAHMQYLFGGKETVRYQWPSRRGGFTRTGYQTELRRFHDCIDRNQVSDSTFLDAIPTYETIERVLKTNHAG